MPANLFCSPDQKQQVKKRFSLYYKKVKNPLHFNIKSLYKRRKDFIFYPYKNV
jgi:hypothetical protein